MRGRDDDEGTAGDDEWWRGDSFYGDAKRRRCCELMVTVARSVDEMGSL